MSATGDSTRDWLLKKLLKASRALQEQQAEIGTLKELVEAQEDRYLELHGQLTAARLNSSAETDHLHDLVQGLSNNRQIEVYLQTSPLGLDNIKLDIMSIAGGSGETTVTVAYPLMKVEPFAGMQG